MLITHPATATSPAGFRVPADFPPSARLLQVEWTEGTETRSYSDTGFWWLRCGHQITVRAGFPTGAALVTHWEV